MISLRKLTQNNFLFVISSRFLTSQTPDTGITTSKNYDHLITIAGREKNFAEIHNLLNKQCRHKCYKPSKTFSFITNTESETDLKLLLDELVQALARLDKYRKISFEALINRLWKFDRTQEALNVVDFMIHNKCGADVVTFHPICNALTKKRKMDEAWKLIDFMKDRQILPDLTAYNYILAAYCTVGDLKSAGRVLIKMEEESFAADALTYDAAVFGLCKVKKVETAMMVLRRMEDEGVRAKYSTYVHIISALLELGYYAQVVEFVMGYKGKDRRLDYEMFGLLGSRLIKMERFDEAIFVLKEMKNSGFVLGSKLDQFYWTNVLNES